MANFRLSRKICICLVIVLIFSNSVFALSVNSSVNAQASYTRIGQFNQYITNNYGSQNADVNTSLLIGMYQSLAKLAAPGVAYGIDRINHTYYLTGTLTYLEEYLMQITENQYDIYKTEDTYLDGLSSAVTDIKTNTTNTAAATNAMLQLLNTLDWQNASLSTFGYYTSLNDAVLDQNKLTSNYSGNTVFVRVDLSDLDIYNKLLSVTLPVIPFNAETTYTDQFVISHVYGLNNSLNGALSLTDEVYPLVYDSYSTFSSLYTDGLGRTYSSGGINAARRTLIFEVYNPILCYSFVTTSPTIKYMTSGSPDYYVVMDNYYLKKIAGKNNDDIVQALNDLEVNIEVNDSINVTPINLDVEIGINDFTEVNTISNKLRTWLSTGVGVSALIGALDQLDDSFFTLYNRNVIETINSGYTDFYD